MGRYTREAIARDRRRREEAIRLLLEGLYGKEQVALLGELLVEAIEEALEGTDGGANADANARYLIPRLRALRGYLDARTALMHNDPFARSDGGAGVLSLRKRIYVECLAHGEEP